MNTPVILSDKVLKVHMSIMCGIGVIEKDGKFTFYDSIERIPV